ncbi:MAG: DUF4249 family protein [Bacteroidota bacterium]
MSLFKLKKLSVMKRVFFTLLTILLIGVLNSCKTDFDINAEQKDITVVYGLLDQAETTHYIKITKAFLGEQNALVMATDPANSNYNSEIQVKIEEYNNGTRTWFAYLNDTIINNKESGAFYSPTQKVYVFHKALNEDRRYKLTITNTETGKEVTAETLLVKDFNILSPLYYSINPQISFITPAGKYIDGEAKWDGAVNGRLYEPTIRFHYTEINKTTLAVDSTKYVDWILPSQKSAKLDGKETLLSSYNGETFFKILQGAIKVDNNLERKIGKVDFMLSVGGDELSTYIDLNRPSTSIIQERPVYTNIGNGIGIFSCRHTKVLRGFSMSGLTATEVINGQYTSELGFVP